MLSVALISGCVGISTVEDEPEPKKEPSLVASDKVACLKTDNANVLEGCWVAQHCVYTARDFIDDGISEYQDYWSAVILSFTNEPEQATVLGVKETLPGKMAASVNYYSNNSCSGEPTVTSYMLLGWWYKPMFETKTVDNVDVRVLMKVGMTVIGETNENGRRYDIYRLSGDLLCLGVDYNNPIVLSSEITIPSRLDSVCFKYAPPGSASWMTSQLIPWEYQPR